MNIQIQIHELIVQLKLFYTASTDIATGINTSIGIGMIKIDE